MGRQINFSYIYAMKDYMVVGLGLAGIAFCEMLERMGRSYMVIDAAGPKASEVAGGIYNPVVLKRINKAWKAEDQLPMAVSFYDGLERKLGLSLHHRATVFRRFVSAEEQKLWLAASETPALNPYLLPQVLPNKNPALRAPFGFGEVRGSGRVDTRALLNGYADYLDANGLLIRDRMEFSRLKLGEGYVSYGGLKAARIVFATGSGLLQNPYFNYLPLQGNKGEYLEILSPALKEQQIIKAAIFLIPVGGDRYLAGATYDWKDKDPDPTRTAANYLLDKLEDLLLCPYEVSGQVAGIRPTVPDRRPLVGQHPAIKYMYVLNGLGSRGVMLAPYVAERLYMAIEGGEPLDPDMDVSRYKGRYISGQRPGGHNG